MSEIAKRSTATPTIKQADTGIQVFTRLLPMIGLLWGFFLLRAHI